MSPVSERREGIPTAHHDTHGPAIRWTPRSEAEARVWTQSPIHILSIIQRSSDTLTQF